MDANVYRSDVRDKINYIKDHRTAGDSAVLAYCDEILKYGKDQRENALIGFAHYSKGCVYYGTNEVASFFFEMLSACEPLLAANEYADYVRANLLLGTMSAGRGNTPDGLDYFERALEVCKEHNLPDAEWQVHFRLATMYQTLDDFDRALTHYTRTLYYIEGHLQMFDRAVWLAAVYGGIGGCYLKKEESMQALVYLTKLEQECKEYLDDSSALLAECFAARVYAALKDSEKFKTAADAASKHSMEGLPLLDVFSEIYDYLKLLLEKKDRTHFSEILGKTRELAEKTTVRYLQKKLLTLKLRADKEFGDEESLKNDAVEFYELSEAMAREDRMMMKRDIARRHEVQELKSEHRMMEQTNRTLLVKSETDDLTGIYNRYKLNVYGDTAMSRAAKNGTPIAVEIMDIDFFTDYNDHYGRMEGDKALRFVADEVSARVKEFGAVFAARYGGAEFVLIYEGYTDKEVFGIARILRDSIAEKRVEHRYAGGKAKYITVSQGIYWGVPEEETKLWDFLHAADNVRYRLKQKTAGSILVGKAENEKTSAYATEDGIETVDPIVRYRGNIEDL